MSRNLRQDQANSKAKTRLILIVEDEQNLVDEIRIELNVRGYIVESATKVADGLAQARADAPDLLIVDRMLPDGDGLSMIEALRQEGFNKPVLVMSALSAVDERIKGLKVGGDDYLVKPFALAELTARVEALLRRVQDDRAVTLNVGEFAMDLLEHTVKRAAADIELLPREFKLFEFFLRRPGQLVTRSMLLEGVWHYRFIPNTNVLEVHIGNLRRKIDIPGRPSFIRNMRGVGYMFSVDS